MKNIMKKTTAIAVVISMLSGCFSTEHYLITDFRFWGVEQINPEEINDVNKRFRSVRDTLKHKLFFEIETIMEYQYGYLNNLSLVESCYATTVPQKVDNELILESLELRLDADIYFETDTIFQNTDLWNHPTIKKYRCYHTYDVNLDSNIVIGFSDSFYDKINIPLNEYTIELVCLTNDNKKMSKSIKLILDL